MMRQEYSTQADRTRDLSLGVLVVTVVTSLFGCSEGDGFTETQENQRIPDIRVESLRSYSEIEPPFDLVLGDDASPLGSLRDARFVSDSTAAVLDGGRRLLLTTLATGTYREIGNPGEGPGEFGDLAMLAVDQTEGRIYVFDWPRTSIHVYSSEGQWLESTKLPQEAQSIFWSGLTDKGALVGWRMHVDSEEIEQAGRSWRVADVVQFTGGSLHVVDTTVVITECNGDGQVRCSPSGGRSAELATGGDHVSIHRIDSIGVDTYSLDHFNVEPRRNIRMEGNDTIHQVRMTSESATWLGFGGGLWIRISPSGDIARHQFPENTTVLDANDTRILIRVRDSLDRSFLAIASVPSSVMGGSQ